MILRFYNTLTRRKDVLEPLDPTRVRLYVCGPTVYDLAHIGNARPVIVFDVLFRVLRHVYGATHVIYVRNITDVDDKINARAAHSGVSIRQLTDETTAHYIADTRALGCLDPTHQPRATDYINAPEQPIDMVRLISKLIERGHAYVAEGHVLFDVPSMAPYGALSRRPMDEMIAGARVDVAPYKRNPADFVLWKPSTPEQPGWDSPFVSASHPTGRGRPGWHIECSTMSAALLGEAFDIHGGGLDLVFPHHENEIAQTCCAFGTQRMASIFMHNGFLNMEGEKMSKSLGNFATIRDVLGEWPADVVRLAMLQTHYRQPLDWTLKRLQDAEKTIAAWRARLEEAQAPGTPDDAFFEALGDDLNTPLAISRLHALEGAILHGAARLLGFFEKPPADVPARAPERVAEADTLLAARHAARAAKNWAESDRLRAELLTLGIEVKDNKDGSTTWNWL